MARLDPLDRRDLKELEPLLQLFEASMGFLPNSVLTMAHRPDVLTAFAGLAGAVLGPGDIDAGLKRMISEVASKAAGCQYCVAHTSHGAHAAGVPQAKLDDIWVFETSPHFTEAERAALGVAMKAAQVPNLVEDADFEALKAHYSNKQIAEILSVISLFGFLNRWNDSLATPLEDEPLAFAEATNPGGSWSPGKHRAGND
ncbi:MAG: carboxymuconolactone decarboxylase family protein [Alphaproteobacteria bacterium]|nr:MAG: carboxymuconolactone decarboxylase family protein [Alphaproteobacteria bacterium]